jgi:large conductance mechanosensitive channel
MLKEFKEFIIKGNMFELAVGVIIGAAFGKVVTSFTDLLLGTITYFTGTTEVGAINILQKTVEGKTTAVNVAPLINGLIHLLIVGFALFLVVKAVNKLRKTEAAAPATPPAPSAQELLLTEIRDLLKK